MSRHEFEGLAKQYHTGQKLRAVSRWDQFIGLSMSQLAGRQSLRDIEANLRTQQHKLYHLGAKVKLHVGLNHSDMIPEFVAISELQFIPKQKLLYQWS